MLLSHTQTHTHARTHARAHTHLCRLLLGRRGVEQFMPLPPMNDLEAEGLAAMRTELVSSIQKGVDFVGAK
jgi:hypothetical protein